jgi:hypothetical protein
MIRPFVLASVALSSFFVSTSAAQHIRPTRARYIPQIDYYQNFLPARQRNFADVDGDGVNEILEVFGGFVHVYHVVSHAPAYFGSWPQAIEDAGDDDDYPREAPAVGEVIRAHPGLEIVTVTGPEDRAMNLNIFSSEGELLFNKQWTDAMPFSYSFGLADLDGDGDEEIVVGAFAWIDFKYWTMVYAFQEDGSPVAGRWPVKLERVPSTGSGSVNLAIGDLDGDGDVEVVYGAVLYCVACWEPVPSAVVALNHDGSGMFGYAMPSDEGGVQRPSLADLDGDGKLEILFTTRVAGNSYLHVLNWQGQETMERKDAGYIAYPPVPGDLNGDGSLEIIVPDNGSENTYVRDKDGALISEIPFSGDLALADVDDDGLVEIIVGSRTYPGMRINAVHYIDGSQPPGWPIVGKEPLDHYNDPDNAFAIAGDLDNDSELEVMLGNTLVEVPAIFDPHGLLWPRYRCEATHSGRYRTR